MCSQFCLHFQSIILYFNYLYSLWLVSFGNEVIPICEFFFQMNQLKATHMNTNNSSKIHIKYVHPHFKIIWIKKFLTIKCSYPTERISICPLQKNLSVTASKPDRSLWEWYLREGKSCHLWWFMGDRRSSSRLIGCIWWVVIN